MSELLTEKTQKKKTGLERRLANLKKGKPFKTAEEARRAGANGGKASGESKRERKRFADYMEKRLNEKIDVTLTKPKAEGGGEYETTMTRKEYIALIFLQKAVKGMEGAKRLTSADIKAYQTIEATIGEKPVDKLEATFGMPQEADLNKIKRWRAESLKK